MSEEKNSEGIPVKDVYEFFRDRLNLNDLPPCKEKKFLDIPSINFDRETADDFRYMSRILAGYRNMPIAFFNNRSGGVHCGFFFKRCQPFSEIDKFVKEHREKRILTDDDTDEDVSPILIRFLDIIKEMDIHEEYEYYHFGN